MTQTQTTPTATGRTTIATVSQALFNALRTSDPNTLDKLQTELNEYRRTYHRTYTHAQPFTQVLLKAIENALDIHAEQRQEAITR